MKKNVALVMIIFSVLSTAVEALGTCYLEKFENSSLHLTSNEPSKEEQVKLARENPQMFCEKNLELRFLNVNPKFAAKAGFICQSTLDENINSSVNQTLFFEVISVVPGFSTSGYQPWLSSLIPTQFAQNISLENSELRDYIRSEYVNISNSSDHKNNYNSIISKFTEQHRIGLLKHLTGIFSKTPRLTFNKHSFSNFLNRTIKKSSSGLEDNVTAQTTICADLDISNTISCVSALKRAYEIAKPVYFSELAYMPISVWEKLFSNETFYVEGLRRAALRIIGRLQNNKKSLGFILDDLFQSFKESGLTKDQAIDAAYDVLALYGNGGANLSERLARLDFGSLSNTQVTSEGCNENQNSVCGYLDLIAKAIPLLDYESLRDHGSFYSKPKAGNSRCNNQKSYYFWLNAFLARQLISEGFDTKSAILGTYALSVAYQFNRDQGVKGSKTLGANALFRSSYDPVNNIIRTDLANAYAGAVFGAENKIVSIDETLVKLMNASTSVEIKEKSFNPSSNLDQANKYLLFRRLISPFAPFK